MIGGQLQEELRPQGIYFNSSRPGKDWVEKVGK